MTKSPKKNEKISMSIVLGIVLVLFGGGFFLVKTTPKAPKEENENSFDTADPTEQSPYQIQGFIPSEERLVYTDHECGISFRYPSNWEVTKNTLPLPKTPISQVIFDAPAAQESTVKSVLAFICYEDAVAFNTLYSATAKSKELVYGKNKWQRVDTFAYSVVQNKEGESHLVIFQMPHTQYDIIPNSLYEGVFKDILSSVE